MIEKGGNYLIHKDILRQQVQQKHITASTKNRSQVRGGGCKPWKQKGTGRARAGSNRSPLWKGGGVIFGPKPKVIKFKLNKKERKLALQTLLYNRRNNILIINNLEDKITNSKTKLLIGLLENCRIELDKKILLIISKKTIPLKLSVRNIKNLQIISASSLNTLSLLKAEQILMTPLAINDIKETFCD